MAASQPIEPGYLNLKQAAQYLNISLTFLKSKIREQQAPMHHRIGKRRLFKREDLDTWVTKVGYLDGDVSDLSGH